MILKIIKVIALMAIYTFIWCKLEEKMYGERQPRKVDDIMMLLLIPVFWLAVS